MRLAAGPWLAAGLSVSSTVASVLLALPAAADPSPCSSAWLQDDAGTGTDAADTRTWAAPLPAEGRFSGLLVPPGAAGPADPVDWYAVPTDGRGETVMVEADFHYPKGMPGTPPNGVYLQVEAWAPGAETVTLTGTMTEFGGQNVTFVNTVAGTWHVRVSLVDLRPAGACVAPDVVPPGAPHARAPLYALYFGCNPHCLPR